MPETDPNDDGSEVADRTPDETQKTRPTAEAKRYRRRAVEQPTDVREEQERLIELLSAGKPTERNDLECSAAASGALVQLARDDPASLREFLPVLIEELRRETEREIAPGSPENRDVSRTVRDRLVRAIASILVDTSETAVEGEAFADFAGAVTTDLEDRTVRAATKAFFASATERSRVLASNAQLQDELLTHPDAVVRAWSVATVGRVAAEHPDAVAGTARTLRELLTSDDTTVQHNAVEALAVLAGPRPDTVVPAVEDLGTLLAHEDVAIQHNAAGVLGRLANEYPDTVMQAVEELGDLRDHDDEAVRRIATGALARLAEERPEAVADRLSPEF